METGIVYLLIGRNMRLQAKKWKRDRGKATYGLISALPHEVRRIVCGMVWDIHLLRTSILVTKTPLTTLKCLSHKYIGYSYAVHVSIANTEGRITSALKGINEDMSRAWKLFVDYC